MNNVSVYVIVLGLYVENMNFFIHYQNPVTSFYLVLVGGIVVDDEFAFDR